ncbi:MAG: 50S ribosomal protein L29 [Bacteroidales bacterium]|jgi:large subunit ribosomal protein L29|nr:50S ribosomal protein L29 [Bacteroidales bacterium]MDD3166254.1 50S ribosomal protein L29 [Bacteroidales bacterium]MDD4770464.1 50S ribosomal protein L29 [Bacteroidales bacterium]HKL92374.1 50S ribosomal protein L29 [Bacteroidales bacterium]
MKTSEIRELTNTEIAERIEAENARLDQMKMQHSISPLDNPNQITNLRRDIARFKTILRERELTQQN